MFILDTWRMSETDAEVWRQAELLARRCFFGKGQTIYHQGERGTTIHFILDGRVKLSTSFPDGIGFVLDILGRNGMFGEGAAVTGFPYLGSATAIEHCELLLFDIHRLNATAQEYPHLGPALMRVLATRHYVFAQRLQHMSHMTSEMRIGELLHRVAELQRIESGEAPASLALTHEQIASLSGFNRVTVSRTLKRMRDCGAIDIVRGRIRIVDSDQLLSGKKLTA